jgi:trehalose/maltose hydrolase-like predicted phosphorylase
MESLKLIFVANQINISDLKKLKPLCQSENFEIICFSDNYQFLNESFIAENFSCQEYNDLEKIRHLLIDDFQISPEKSVVISDKPSTVKYFRTNGWGYLIGYGNNDIAFLENYADKVLQDLKNIDPRTIKNWFLNEIKDENWCLTYNYFSENEEKLRETMTTIGNGFVGVRGALGFMKADEATHYPATYVAGLFNKLGTEIKGKTIYNNDFVNIPNAFAVRFKFKDDDNYWSLNNLKILDYKHQLNMKSGEVKRKVIVEHHDGRRLKYIESRFAAMHDMHILGHKVSVTPLNFNAEIEFLSEIDGDIINYGVKRYRKLSSKHIHVKSTTVINNALHLQAETTNSKVELNLSVFHESLMNAKQSEQVNDKTAAIVYNKSLAEKESFNLERTIFIDTSRNKLKQEKQALGYDLLLQASATEWEKIWRKIDIKIEGDRYSQELIRMQMYHLISSASPNNIELDTATTARGLHGEAYRGHIFWDELFILPFYFKHFPEVSRALLLYRYRRLDTARKHARKNKREGALIPWQIADTGEEETQEIHYNPMSKDWDPDLSRKQRHVSIAVAYNIINYFNHTQDLDFIEKEGGEMLIEIARYWASKVIYDEKTNRYHIKRVMGPDEFHEKYPKNTVNDGGVDDNAYTNIMVSWLFKRVSELLPNISDDVKEDIEFDKNEEEPKWLEISIQMYISLKGDILEQFKGYFELDEIDLKKYEEEYEDVGRMDRILKSEDDTPDHYKVAKQADTLMLFYLLEPEEVKGILNKIGYKVSSAENLLKKNFDYYLKRTSHGSTLSYIVHAYLLDYFPERKNQLWKWYIKSLSSDFDDIQGGTTKEGIHCGVMSGNISLIYNCFAGFKMGEPIKLSPSLPKHWKSLSLKIHFQKQSYWFRINQNTIRISTEMPHDKSVLYKDKSYSFKNQSDIIIKI